MTAWERKHGESSKAYDAFCAYMGLPATERSLMRLVSDGHGTKPLVGRWSAKYEWVDRAAAWDDELQRRKREASADAIVAMTLRHADDSRLLQEALLVPARVLVERLRSETGLGEDDVEQAVRSMPASKLLELTGQLARIMPSLAQAERQARGLSEGYQQQESGGDMERHGPPDGAWVWGVYAALEEAGLRPEPPPPEST